MCVLFLSLNGLAFPVAFSSLSTLTDNAIICVLKIYLVFDCPSLLLVYKLGTLDGLCCITPARPRPSGDSARSTDKIRGQDSTFDQFQSKTADSILKG